MTSLPPFPSPDHEDRDELAGRLGPFVAAAHGLWGSPRERRRMRAFGFIPANETGVLKRDWHGLRVRVSPELLRAILPDVGEMSHLAPGGELRLDGGPFDASPQGLTIAEALVDLVRAYERWVEAREGRDGRLSRGPWDLDRRPFNTLAETRRLQRMLAQARPPRRMGS